MKLRKYIPLFLIPILSCSQSSYVIESEIFCFGETPVKSVIRLYEGDMSDLLTIGDIFYEYDKLCDNYSGRGIANNLYTINNTNDEVTIDSKLYNVLLKAKEATSLGADNFNYLTGSLAKKWKESLSNKEILSNTVIAQELEKISNSDLLFKENNVVQRVGEAEIDLGGITKGYVIDKAKEYLDSKGYTKYLINAGMSSVLLGEKNTSDGLFRVDFKDLPGCYTKLKNCYVSTSGSSEQGVKIDGQIYSHIINPFTGSAINEQDTVIVINNSGFLGDAFATSLVNNTVEEIAQKEEDLGIKTIVIKNKKIVHQHKDVKVYRS